MSALTMLDRSGDTTIHWTPDRDDEMEAIIAKKMAAGCTFFIIDPRFGSREKLKDARDACRGRTLAIPDADFAAFVSSMEAPAGSAEVVSTPAAPAKVTRRARTAKEVAKSESIGVAPRGGG